MRRLCTLMLLCLVAVGGQSRPDVLGRATPFFALQARTISGIVVDDSGLPLIGATVTVFNTVTNKVVTGTYTDAVGEFSVSVASIDNCILRITYVGFQTQELELGADAQSLTIKLASDAAGLDEVLVVGYGTAYRRDLTGSVSSVRGSDIANLPVNSLEGTLQGRMAGVQISQGSGKLGQGIQVRIRGSASVTASNQPLYIVDGFPIITEDIESSVGEPTNPIADINPNDIESIEVLKDASSAAIYGARASNGVVLITTKRGKAGKTVINANYYYSIQSPTNKREFLNGDQYYEFFNEANGAELFPRNDPFGSATNYSTDWQDQTLGNNALQQFDLSAAGGNEKTKFFASTQLFDQGGILRGSHFARNSGRINIDHNINDRIKMGAGLTLIRTQNDRVSDDNAFSTPMQVVALSPLTPLLDPTTNTTLNADPITGYYNPRFQSDNAFVKTINFRTIGNIFTDFNLLEGVVYHADISTEILSQQENVWYGRNTQDGVGGGYAYDAATRVVNYNTTHTLQYAKSSGSNSFSALAGFSFQRWQSTFNSTEGRNFPSDDFRYVSSATQITAGTSGLSEYRFVSYFGRVNYKFRDKYIINVSGRLDGSSRFGDDNRYGFFPAASVGWVLSEEDFIQGLTFISFLKPRVGYGVTGNAEIPNFGARTLSSPTRYKDQVAIVPNGPADPTLKWETTKQLDFSLDWGLFENKITGTASYYVKNTTDLLLNQTVKNTAGGFGTVLRNVGSSENKGWEVLVSAFIISGPKFKWNTTFNIAGNKNKIIDLNGSIIVSGFNAAIEGQPIGVFYGPKYVGVDPATGDALFDLGEGRTGNTDSLGLAPQQVVGNPNPKFTGGITNNFTLGNFDLSVFFQFTIGQDVFNSAGRFMTSNGWFSDNQTAEQWTSSSRWTQPGDIADVPRLDWNRNNGAVNSSRYVYDASFVRLKTVTLGYNFPKSLLESAKLSSAKVYINAQNLLTITGYNGWDPEVSTNSTANIALGNDFYTTPQVRAVAIGLQIGF